MNDSTSPTSNQSPAPTELTIESELSKLVRQGSNSAVPTANNNAERIRAALSKFTSSSIDELEGLTSELKKMQEFLRSEVDSVQRQIEDALAGINIIVETISPWKSTAASAQPSGPRSLRSNPMAAGEAGHSRWVAPGLAKAIGD
jgi:hypothetical protein